jgi:hypothetical protein
MKQFLTKRYRPERHYMRGPWPNVAQEARRWDCSGWLRHG